MISVTPIEGRVSKWGEGPIWWNDHLLYVDIEGHAVIKLDPETGAEQVFPVGERVGTVVPRESGGYVIAGDNGFSFLSESGEVTLINDPETHRADNRFNDGKCSPDGRFFAGTISLVKKEGDATLYCLDEKQEVTVAYDRVTNSNGIIWSLDGETVYYVDTPRKNIIAFDYDPATGALSKDRSVVDLGHMDSSPDGMTIDSEGKLWVAFCHGACVRRYCPESGDELQIVEIPALETTAVAFGGNDLSDLYVTTGIHKSEVEEHAGKLFKVTGLGVKGVPANVYKG